MILVTGAAGKTGQAVLRALESKGVPVRALVRREEQITAIQTLGANDVAIGDLTSAEELGRTLDRVKTIYLIVPNMHPEEARIGEIAIRAARESGAERIVYHSVLHPQTREMPHHWQKLAVEEQLFASGLDFTILQPAAYMQNLLPYWNEIIGEGVYRVPYGEAGRLSLIDLEDVAEVAATVVTSDQHVGATYELAGSEALSPSRIAEILSDRLDLEIVSEIIPLDQWTEKARASGLGGYALESLRAMFGYYDRFGLVGNSSVVEALLERPATTLGQFVDRVNRSE